MIAVTHPNVPTTKLHMLEARTGGFSPEEGHKKHSSKHVPGTDPCGTHPRVSPGLHAF